MINITTKEKEEIECNQDIILRSDVIKPKRKLSINETESQTQQKKNKLISLYTEDNHGGDTNDNDDHDPLIVIEKDNINKEGIHSDIQKLDFSRPEWICPVCNKIFKADIEKIPSIYRKRCNQHMIKYHKI